MGTAENIITLRKTLRMNQGQFGDAVNVGARSISRYERGYEPGAKVLSKLAELAATHKLWYLRDIFSTAMLGEVVSQINRLPSLNSARRIPVDTLRRWSEIASAARSFSPQMRQLHQEILLYIDPVEHGPNLTASTRAVQEHLHRSRSL